MTEAEGMEYARNELETKRLRRTRAGRRKAKKECVRCGREFVPEHHRQINCSKECSTAHGKARSKVIYNLLHKKEANPACVQCGKTITSRTRRVTCSAGCARDRQIQLTRSKRVPYSREEAERECVQCGKIFSTKHPNRSVAAQSAPGNGMSDKSTGGTRRAPGKRQKGNASSAGISSRRPIREGACAGTNAPRFGTESIGKNTARQPIPDLLYNICGQEIHNPLTQTPLWCN